MKATRILVVEDDPLTADHITMNLQHFGYEVQSLVSSGKEAVQAAVELTPDVVLMDIRLDGDIDGIQAAKQIRTQLDIPIVYLTGYSDEDILDQAKLTEPVAYILKPFTERALHTTIEIALHKHKIDRKLKEHEQWLATTLSSIGDGVMATDREGHILLMNLLAEALTGWKQEDALGKDVRAIFRLICEETHTVVEFPVTKILRENTTVNLTNHILLAKDGGEIPVDGSVAPIRNDTGEVEGTILVFHDTTRRKQAEEQVQLLSSVVEQSSEGIAVSDLEGDLLFVNEAFATLHGYTSEELVGKHLSIFHTPEQLPSVEAANQQIRETGEFNGEIWHVRRDGTIFPGLMHNSLLRDTAGNPVGMIGTLRDITERKQAEEELRQAKDAALKAQQVAEAANQAKSEFLANMSHELRTPLNGILGYAQILKRNPYFTDSQKSGLEIIERSGNHLLQLINDLLELAKIEAKKMTTRPSRISLPKFLTEIAEMVRIQAQQKGIAFRYETTSKLPNMVHADERQLSQILLNLLSNAVKFTEHGGVALKVGYIGIEEGSKCCRKVRFQVSDSGIGIPEQQLHEIFSPFTQVAQHTRETEGTGLGLAITYKLVHLMGSELHVQSTVGKGSTFWFDLDLAGSVLGKVEVSEPESEEHVLTGPGPSSQIIGFKGKTRTILVTDDNDDNRHMIKEMLLAVGFEIIEATDGREAIHKANVFAPDLILLDLMMPVMDGFEMIRHIRQDPVLKTIPVIAISASVFEQTREKSIAAGCDAFLAKPFQGEDLFELLRTHLDLEWIRRDERETQSSKTPSEEPLIIPPAAEELARGEKLAIRGDIAGLRQWAMEMRALDSALIPFTEKVLELASTFQIMKIQTLIGSYIKK